MHRDPNAFHCSCCLLDKNFRIFYRSLYVSAYLDRKISSLFFKHPISTCKSASLSIECYQHSLTDFELRDSKNEPAIFWPVGFLQISRDEKIRGHIQLFSWVKTINLRGKWDAKVCIYFIACGSCQLYPPLQSSSKFFKVPSDPLPCSVSFETRSSPSTSSSLFILTEENLFNKPAFVKADIRLKYQAICCSINQSVLYNISGWCRLLNSIFEKPHFLLVSSPVRHTFRRYFFAFWEKGISFLCFPKGPSKAVHLASKSIRVLGWIEGFLDTRSLM